MYCSSICNISSSRGSIVAVDVCDAGNVATVEMGASVAAIKWQWSQISAALINADCSQTLVCVYCCADDAILQQLHSLLSSADNCGYSSWRLLASWIAAFLHYCSSYKRSSFYAQIKSSPAHVLMRLRKHKDQSRNRGAIVNLSSSPR